MGLLDKLIKEGAEAIKDIASEENKEKASSLLNSLKDTLEEHADGLKKAVDGLKNDLGVKDDGNASTGSAYIPEDYDNYEDSKSAREKILEVLASEFPEYTVRENVSPTEIGGTGKFMNYSMVICKEGTPKLFIMIIGKTTTAHREYRWSREEAEKRGYTFLNFVEHYPNTEQYLKDRLHKYL